MKRLTQFERLHIKAFICLLGLILLILLLVGRYLVLHNQSQQKEEGQKHIPVVTVQKNVWIEAYAEGQLKCFADGIQIVYDVDAACVLGAEAAAQVADLTLTDNVVTGIVLKDTRTNGKVLSVTEEYIELEGSGKIPLSEDVKGYRLYGTMQMCGISDICIGYDFADFCLEDGEICAFLLVREGAMEYIRVLIKTSDYAGIYHEEVDICSDQSFLVRGENQEFAEIYHAGESIEVTAQTLQQTGGRLWIEPETQTGKLQLTCVNRSQGTPLYRGSIELLLTENGIVVINELPLEEYLYNVVPSEMPASYPEEALKAQAICARTYAYLHMLQAGYREYGAHVDDSSSYQVYNNISEQEAATAAVKETYGQLLYSSDGEPVETYYYSTSCGLGSDAHVWKTSHADEYPYLQPKHICESGEVLEEMTEEDFAEYIGTVHSEDFESEESWYRWTYTAARVDTEHMLEVLQKRYQANQELVLTYDEESGEYISEPVKELEELLDIYVESRGAGGVADELILVTGEHTYKVISELNIRYVLNDGVTQVKRQDGKNVASESLLPSAFFTIEIAKEGECVVAYNLVGGGFGHGAGMSQNAAKAMAEQGYSAMDILQFFYTGCQVREAGEE